MNKEFSIISMNCVGGVIYHELGEAFRTPTVNLWFEPKDYLKFAEHLEDYLKLELKETSTEKKYPVGILGDIKVYFMHYPDFVTAKKKWEERKKRINKESLYFIMVQCEGCTKEMVERFDKLPLKHKVIFTAQEYSDISSAVHIAGTAKSDEEVIDLCQYKSKFTGKRWIDEFDYVKFLND